MNAQELYDLREETEFCSGNDLHKFFEKSLGDPSPSGHTEISIDEAKTFVNQCVADMRHNNVPGRYVTVEMSIRQTQRWLNRN